MREFVSRREVLRRFGKATAGLALTGGVIRGQGTDIVVAGNPVEIAISSVSPTTVRITVIPIEGSRSAAFPDTGTLVAEGQGRSVGRGHSAGALNAVKAGNLVVRFKADPPTLHVDTASGQPVQKLTLDSATPGMSFLLPKGQLLGLGEGGPQFDRKGQTFANRSGQAGYQLATHGGRVPIQWLIGTDGWPCLFIAHWARLI
jgi:hypothetical protein